MQNDPVARVFARLAAGVPTLQRAGASPSVARNSTDAWRGGMASAPARAGLLVMTRIWITLCAWMAAAAMATAQSREQSLHILSLRAPEWDSASGDPVPADALARGLSRLTEALRGADGDFAVIHGLPGRTHAQQLAASLPAPWQLTLHASLPGGGTNRTQPGTVTILSRRPAFVARSAEWRPAGQVDVPGGFAFAGFRSGTNVFCLYVADFPGDVASVTNEPAGSLPLRRRELAAQYLLHHVHWLQGTLTNHSFAVAVLADIGLGAGGGLETAGRALQQAGFGAWLAPQSGGEGSLPTPASVILARQTVLRRAPSLLASTAGEFAACRFELGSPWRPANAGAGSVDGSGPATPSWVWIWAGVLSGVCVVTLALWLLVRRGAPAADLFRPRDEVIDLHDAGAGGSPFASATGGAAEARAGLLDHIRSLLGERLIAWLAAQRGRLLVSQDRGTRQVADLESRLTRIQGHFEEQMKNRDQRILELEREIEAREALIRRLLLARAGETEGKPTGQGS